jgi:hypothetical protein
MSTPRVIINSADHVFADGTTLKTLRDALIAASLTGMWHVCWEMAQRYRVEKILCMGCGSILPTQKGTYIQRGGHAIRLCPTCHSRLPTKL